MLSVPEQRFRDKSGVQFTSKGDIRCHALAKNSMRRWRIDHNDMDTPSEELWPECQCEQPAVEGLFVCRWHGGRTPRTLNPPRTILDVLPYHLTEKFKALLEDPDYISRKDDILLLKTRKWQLLEEMQEVAGAEEAWGMVYDALAKLNKGDEIVAKQLLEQAIDATNREKETWHEIYKLDNDLRDLTRTQVQSAKDLQTMATTEQVNAILQNIMIAISMGAEKHIGNPQERNAFLGFIARETGRLANVRAAYIIDQLDAGSGEGD